MPPDSRSVAGILLAAGASRRMSGANKLLLMMDGQPMVRRAARMLVGSGLAKVTVVTGHDAEAVTAALAGLPVTIAYNPDHPTGQMASVRTGLMASPGADGYLIAPADMPALTARDIRWLVGRFPAAAPGNAIVPVFAGEHGHPIVVPGSARAEIVEGGLNFGCRKFLERHPERVVLAEAPSAAFVTDIDTPDAYSAQIMRTRALFSCCI